MRCSCRRAAASIHKSLYGISLDLVDNVLTSAVYIQNVDQVKAVDAVPRQMMPRSSSQELIHGEETEKGFDETRARKEASRCLKCGLICYQHSPKREDVQIKATVNT